MFLSEKGIIMSVLAIRTERVNGAAVVAKRRDE